MKSQIKKNQKVNILPEEVKGATVGTVLKSLKDSMEIEIPKEDVQFYTPDCTTELFAPVDDGMLYFTTVLEEINGNILKLKSSDKYEILQRREYTRIPIEKEIKIKDEDIKCKCLDISAGGMKIEVSKQLNLDKDYKITFNLENSININCLLRPIRLSKDEKTNKFIVSGRFVLLKNIDKIAIVQFCFKKDIENTNR